MVLLNIYIKWPGNAECLHLLCFGLTCIIALRIAQLVFKRFERVVELPYLQCLNNG